MYIPVNRIYDGLGEGDLPDGGHIESVHVVPPVDLVVLVLPVLDGGDVERSSIREHQTSGLQPLVSGEQDRVQHGLVEEAVAHPLRDDDVDLFDSIRQTDLLHLAAEYFDLVGEIVLLDRNIVSMAGLNVPQNIIFSP